MTGTTESVPREEGILLNFFCTPEREAWRIYMRPTWLPRYLHSCFDKHWEAYPVLLDFEDLDRHMQKRGVSYEKRVSTLGDVEVTARGRAANELAVWLSRAFASGVRLMDEAGDENASKARGA